MNQTKPRPTPGLFSYLGDNFSFLEDEFSFLGADWKARIRRSATA